VYLSKKIVIQLAQLWQGTLYQMRTFAEMNDVDWESVNYDRDPSSSSKTAYAEALIENLLSDEKKFLAYLEEVGRRIPDSLLKEIKMELLPQKLHLSQIRNEWKLKPKRSGTTVKRSPELTLRISSAIEFENKIKEIFIKLGYAILVQPEKNGFRPDFLLTDKENKKIIVEVKHYQNSLLPIGVLYQVQHYLDLFNADSAMIVTSTGYTEQTRQLGKDKFRNISLLTVQDLLNRLPKSEQDYLKIFEKTHSYPKIKPETQYDVEEQLSILQQTKKNLEKRYKKAIAESNSQTKGKMLEEIIKDLLNLVPKLKVIGSRVNDGIDEIDLKVRNHNREGVWRDFDGIFYVECKNWSTPATVSEITIFIKKLQDDHITTGLFISINGITGKNWDGAKGEIKKTLSNSNTKVVILNGSDLEEIFKCTDISDKVDERYIDLYT